MAKLRKNYQLTKKTEIKKAPSFTRECFLIFLLTKNLLFSHDIIKVQFMNSNRNFDEKKMKRFNQDIKKVLFLLFFHFLAKEHQKT